MMPVTKTYTTTGAKDPIQLDYLPTSQITAAVTDGVTGTLLLAVEVSLDNVFEPESPDYIAPASARWFTVTGAPTNASGYVTFDGPWRAIRANITTIADGSIIFQVGQSTTPRR